MWDEFFFIGNYQYVDVYSDWDTFLKEAAVFGWLSVHRERFCNQQLTRVGSLRICAWALQASMESTRVLSAYDIVDTVRLCIDSEADVHELDEWMRERKTLSVPAQLSVYAYSDFRTRTDHLNISQPEDDRNPWWDCKYAPQWYRHSAVNEWAVQRTHPTVWTPVEGMHPVCRPLYTYNARFLKLRARVQISVNA